MKEYVVSLNVSFSTPLDAKANSEKEAEQKGKAQFKKLFKEFEKKLNDIADLEIETDYVECQEYQEKKDMKCPACKIEMMQYKIPFVKTIEGVYHICKNKKCLWYGIQRIEVK